LPKGNLLAPPRDRQLQRLQPCSLNLSEA
jgi:hypothetical protein